MYLSDVLPTAWQAVAYAEVPDGGTVAVLGLGPIGDMACRIAAHQGASRVIGIDRVPARLARAAARGTEVIDLDAADVGDAVRDTTDGRGVDAVVDAVGMEAHGSPIAKLAHQANVRRWVDDILPLLTDADPLGVDDFATHRIPLPEAPAAYESFQHKKDGMVKVLFRP